MKISVVGCGYLGAVHAACMAELGHDVLGIDVDDTKVAALSAGRAPFYEPGFEELLTRALGTGRLRFTTTPGDDPAAVLAGIAPVSRDNARTPVHWDSSEKAGFTTGEPWIALAPDHGTVNAAAQVGVPGSVFEHYRQLIALRHDDDALALGTFRLLAADHPTAWVILRQWRAPEAQRGGIEQLLLIAQCAREDLPLTGDGALLAALAAEGLDPGEWSGAEQVLRAADPDVQPGSGHAGLEALPGWDSVLLRRRA